MSVSALRVADSPTRVDRSFRISPAVAWRNYLAAVAERDVEGVFAAMTIEYARQLRALRPSREFGPLFELWCASQPRQISVTTCCVQGDIAALEGRDGRDLCRIQMRHVEGSWRIDAEEFTRSGNQPLVSIRSTR